MIVGLGNPGTEYKNTRHNVGFMTINNMLSTLNVNCDSEKFKGEFTKVSINGEEVILAMPLTYMNLSGEFVLSISKFFKIKTEDILVIYDDLDTPVGNIRLKKKGSSGGQNGIKNIIDLLKTSEIKRIKIGIGKPKFETKKYVLSKFNNEEDKLIKSAIKKASAAAYDFIFEDFEKVMSKHNATK